MVVTVFNCFKPHSIIWLTIAFISHERKLKIVSTDVVKKEPSEVFPEIALRREFLRVNFCMISANEGVRSPYANYPKYRPPVAQTW